ncbi:hypothetical protein E1B28_011556 [Marasmius oreades]|uniref:Steroid 5-alpha reductase C-terminal domain-containing protein n=1 Tax=Marasmius oreades TaxID=181124 RepID=A0A9P7RUD7_9AGAR|nr:uncharacterized protein E1B28_011556 [Marasmius oreades]KAG7089924.1 hypothetical protein E1B28_011556 [Marasmius oreades]
MVVFSRLIPSLTISYAIQSIFASVFVPLQEDRYYDLAGSIGFLSTTFVSMYYPTLRDSFAARELLPLPALSTFAPRQLLLSGALSFWSSRLGIFLFERALKAGGDSRFDKIKRSPARFTTAWMVQAAWTFLVGMPVYLNNAIPSAAHPPLSIHDFVGLGLFAASLVLEVLADYQKSKWRRAKDNMKHNEKFISNGVWSISRHPNYLGEIGIWTGIWILSTRSLSVSSSPRVAIALSTISPLLTYLLLTKVSGVPLIEKANNKKFGTDPRWLRYKRTVPVLWPWQ